MRNYKIFGPIMNRSWIKVGSRPFDHKARQEQINVVGVGRKKKPRRWFSKGRWAKFPTEQKIVIISKVQCRISLWLHYAPKHCYTSEVPSFNSTYHMCAIITRALYIFNPFFTAIYIVEWSVLQTIYVLNKEILQFQGLKSMVYNQEWFQIKRGL